MNMTDKLNKHPYYKVAALVLLLLWTFLAAAVTAPAQTTTVKPYPYLGRFASDPTCRTIGSTYYNTTTNTHLTCLSTSPSKWGTAQGNWALKFVASKAHHVNRGSVYAINTSYGNFAYEMLVKVQGGGYGLSVSNGGKHIILFGFSGDAVNGYTLTGNVWNELTGVATSVNSTEKIRHDRWTHLTMWGEGTRLGYSINGVPSVFVTWDGVRRISDINDTVWMTGGSDHLNSSMVLRAERVFETTLPHTNYHNTVFRPPVETFNLVQFGNGAKAGLLGDYSSGLLIDTGAGINGTTHHGVLFETLSAGGVDGSVGQPAVYNLQPYTTNRNPAHLPQWVIDPFAWPTDSPPLQTVISSSRIYDDFSRPDVHYGSSTTLGLGTTRIGGAAWTASAYGILNGNAYPSTTSAGYATVADTQANDTTILRKPDTFFHTNLALAYQVIFRYCGPADHNFLQIDEYGQGFVFRVEAGVTTNTGVTMSFGTGWTEARVTASGNTITTFNGATLKDTRTITANAACTGNGWGANSPVARVSEFAVL